MVKKHQLDAGASGSLYVNRTTRSPTWAIQSNPSPLPSLPLLWTGTHTHTHMHTYTFLNYYEKIKGDIHATCHPTSHTTS